MVLNSLDFILVFLPTTLAVFQLSVRFADRRVSVGVLIAASVIFHAYAGWVSLLMNLASASLTYLFARAMLKVADVRLRKRSYIFSIGVVTVVLILGYFKYAGFILGSANTYLGVHFHAASVLLPLGLSFLTFQEIALLADVHAGRVRELNLLDYALFVLFFPRVIAGPILLSEQFFPQVKKLGTLNTARNIAIGICLFSIGLAKKTLISDHFAQLVAPAFGGRAPPLLTAWTGALAYTFQLYFDFSGYSDMALGVARMFGIRFPMNFNSPFKANNIVEYWSRWHITLTRFLTAYIYTPLVLHITRWREKHGKSLLRGRRSNLSAIVALIGVPTFATMIVAGVWHGTGWQFLCLGMVHGAYITINQAWRLLRPHFWTNEASYQRVMRPVGRVLTFLCIVIALVFLRAYSVSGALRVLEGMCGLRGFWPYQIDVLQIAHINPIVVMQTLHPLRPFIWFSIALAWVWLLPNTQEILARYYPTWDSLKQHRGRNIGVGPFELRAPVLSSRLAVAIAAICLLGILSISGSAPFIYGKF